MTQEDFEDIVRMVLDRCTGPLGVPLPEPSYTPYYASGEIKIVHADGTAPPGTAALLAEARGTAPEDDPGDEGD
jgi:hypothetical protein